MEKDLCDRAVIFELIECVVDEFGITYVEEFPRNLDARNANSFSVANEHGR